MQACRIDQTSRGLGPQSICSYGCGLVSRRVSRKACGFVTVARDFLISRCSLSHQVAWRSVLKSRMYGFLKTHGRWDNILLTQPATSWIMTFLTALYFLKLGHVPCRPTPANSLTASSSRQKGQNTGVCKHIFSGNSSSHDEVDGLFSRITSTGDQKA